MTKKVQAARFRRLADYIERQPKGQFDQHGFFHRDGTPMDIAGHCIEMVPSLRKHRGDDCPHWVAGDYLGLDGVEELRGECGLFHATAPWQTQKTAVKELRRRAREIESEIKPAKRRVKR